MVNFHAKTLQESIRSPQAKLFDHAWLNHDFSVAFFQSSMRDVLG
jgi:hypothetical protein